MTIENIDIYMDSPFGKYLKRISSNGEQEGKGNHQAMFLKSLNDLNEAAYKGVLPVTDTYGEQLKPGDHAEIALEAHRRGQAKALGKDYSDPKTANSSAANKSKFKLGVLLGQNGREHGLTDPTLFLPRVIAVRTKMVTQGSKVQSVQNALCTAIRKQLAEGQKDELTDTDLEQIVLQAPAKAPALDKVFANMVKTLTAISEGSHPACNSEPFTSPGIGVAKGALEKVISTLVQATERAELEAEAQEVMERAAKAGITLVK